MSNSHKLTGGMAWTLMGYTLPMVAAIVMIPLLIHRMGADRFGLLTFIWMIVGYSNFLDLGIGRALTQGIAERLGRGKENEIPQIILAGIVMLLLIGTAGALVMAWSSGWISTRFLKIPTAFVQDAQHSINLAALAIPVVILGAALRGVLEGFQRFRAIGVVRSTAGTLIYLSAAPVLLMTNAVWAVVGVSLLVRALEVAIYAYLCFSQVKSLTAKAILRTALLRPLLSFGLWSTANNMVGSLMSMAYLDKLFLSSLAGTAALAYFSTPFDMVTKALIIPTSFAGVLFPTFSNMGNQSSSASRLVTQSIKIIIFGMLPVFLLLITLARPILSMWLGQEFSDKGTLVFQIICVGMFSVSISYVPFAFIQAIGRPDLTAKRHFMELPFYLIISYFCTKTWGAIGAGSVWCLWSLIDLALILRIMKQCANNYVQANQILTWLSTSLFLGIAFLVGSIGSPLIQWLSALLLPVIFLSWSWRFLLEEEDRQTGARWFKMARGSFG